MRAHLRGPAGLALTVTAVLAATVTGVPAGAAPAAAVPVTPAAPAGISAARQLLLITGDRLIVSPADGQHDIGVRAARRPDVIITLGAGHQTLEIPAAALPYLGRGLSPDLFEPGALERAESGGRLPVRVTFTRHRPEGGPALPGLTVTRSAPGVTDGYLTPASAVAFGAALRRQYRADQASGRYGSDGLFAGGVTVTLGGAPQPAAISPAASPKTKKTYQLTIRATDLRGRADTGDLALVFSLGSGALELPAPAIFRHGIARFRVPAGHYCASAIFSAGDSVRDVVLPQFAVRARATTVHVRARSATSRFTIRTPRPATEDLEQINVLRRTRAGVPIQLGLAWQGATGWINPIRRAPSIGSLRTYSHATLLSPPRVRHAYAYDLQFPGPPGVIPAQHFTARRASLATVTQRYYQDPPTRKAVWLVWAGTPRVIAAFPFVQFRMPAVVTQYLTAGPRFVWQMFGWYQPHPDITDLVTGQTGDYRAYARGQRLTENWNQYPLHPQPDTAFGGPASLFPAQVSAGRIGSRLELATWPFSDNQFGHLGPGYGDDELMPVTGHYEVDQDGRPIASGSPVGTPISVLTLSSRPSVIRFTLTAARRFTCSRCRPPAGPSGPGGRPRTRRPGCPRRGTAHTERSTTGTCGAARCSP